MDVNTHFLHKSQHATILKECVMLIQMQALLVFA